MGQRILFLSKTKEGLEGITYSKDRARWHAQIRIGNKQRHIGYYACEFQAAMAYFMIKNGEYVGLKHRSNLCK